MAIVFGTLLRDLRHSVKVAAGAECVFHAGHDRNPSTGVIIKTLLRVDHLNRMFDIESISPFIAVHRDDHDVVLFVVVNWHLRKSLYVSCA